MDDIPKNMYSDSIYQWNVFKGCHFDCTYCVPSFQRQAKRQKPVIDKNGNSRGCQQCYDYTPHFHPERLRQSLPNTTGDQFIWACSSGDIFFAKEEWMELILKRINELPHKTFFFQTKNPIVFHLYDFPENVLLGITLESDIHYPEISNAPTPYERVANFTSKYHLQKIVTIEPLLDFNFDIFLSWLMQIGPERIYIGFDTKKCGLPEPDIYKVRRLIYELRRQGFDVREKYMKEDKK